MQALLRHASLSITADTYATVLQESQAALVTDIARSIPRLRAVGNSRPTDAPT